MNLHNLIVTLSANAAQFKATLVSAANDVRVFAGEINTAAGKGDKAAKALGVAMAAMGAAALAAMGASAAAAIQLEASMQNVATLWDVNQQRAQGTFVSIKAATQAMIDLSTTLPQSANTLAQGLYDVASSGFQGSEAIVVLTASAKAASAGLTDTATAARGITAVMNAYGPVVGDAARVSDILFQTVNLGIVTFPQLANVLGDFVGLTATAGVKFEDAAAALATMTVSGVTAAEAGTSLNRVVKALIKPSADMTAALHAAGLENGLVALQTLGLQGTMEKLATVVGYDNVQSWTRLFPEIRATRGALALIAQEGGNYTRIAGKMTDETQLLGATQRALDEQSKSTAYQLTLLKNQVVALGIGFGQSMLPFIKPVVEALQSLVSVFTGLPDWMKTATAAGAVFTAVVIGLGGAFLLLAPKIVAAIALINSSTTASYLAVGAMDALSAAMPVIGIIGAALTLAAPIIFTWARAHGEAKQRVDDLKSSLDKENGAITDETVNIIRNTIAKKGLADKASLYGISIETLAGAMSGNKDALDTFNSQLDTAEQQLTDMGAMNWGAQGAALYAKINDLRGAVQGQNKDLEKAKKAWEDDKRIKDGVNAATDGVRKATEAEKQAQEDAITAAKEHDDALKSLTKTLAKMLDPLQAYTDGLDKVKAAQTHNADDFGNMLQNQQEKERRSLDDRILAEQRALDDRLTIEKRGIDDRYQLEYDALDKTKQVLEKRQKANKDALDLEMRDARDALDRRQRDEKHAADDEIDAIKKIFDARKKVLDDNYQTERDRLIFELRWAFGQDRENLRAQLKNLDETHQTKLDELDTQEKKEKRVVSDGLDDRLTVENNAFDDMKKSREKGLEDQTQIEKDAWQTQYDNAKAAIDRRKELDLRAFDDRKTDLQRSLDDEKTRLQRNLDDKYNLLRQQHERERTLASEQRPLTLAEYQKTLDDQYKQYQAHNTNMAIIAGRGGLDMASAVMAEIGKLPPEIVAAVAGAGPDAFNKFIDSMKTRAGLVDATTVGEPIVSLLKRIGEIAGPEFAMALATKIGSDPNAAKILQDKLLELIAPREVSPGVWRTPKPGGGFYPGAMTMSANGNILRFADGGEYHQATIAPAGSWRVWAEPETGGEAYIPLANSKRSGSLSILRTVADAFGYGLTRMADGGVLGSIGGRSGGNSWSVNMPIHIEARVAAGVDPDAVGAAIARETERAVRNALDDMHRQIVVKAWRG